MKNRRPPVGERVANAAWVRINFHELRRAKVRAVPPRPINIHYFSASNAPIRSRATRR